MAWMDTFLGLHIWKIVGLVVSTIFIIISYVYTTFQKDKMGVTTEYSALLTYAIGVIVMQGQYAIAVILSIFILVILSSKEYLQQWKEKISRDELGNSLKFAVIALVILPLLPDMKFSFSDVALWFGMGKEASIARAVCQDSFMHFLDCFWHMKFFNPYSIWKFVVLMTAVEYAGYIFSKTMGPGAGIVASGAIGGLVSSTATTAAMSKKSQEDVGNIDAYVLGTLTANSIMFLRVMIITLVIAPQILATVFVPAMAMFVVFFVSIAYFWYQGKKKKEQKNLEVEKNLESPFQILPAIKFAIFILFIKFISALIQLFQIKTLYVPFAIVSGLADVDAPTLEFASLGRDGQVSLFFAGMLILIAVMSNNAVKGSLAWRFGAPQFGKSVVGVFLASALVGFLSIGITWLIDPTIVHAIGF